MCWWQSSLAGWGELDYSSKKDRRAWQHFASIWKWITNTTNTTSTTTTSMDPKHSLWFLHKEALAKIVVEDNFIEWRLLTPKESLQVQLSNNPLSSIRPQKGIPTTSNVIINSIAIGHDSSKEQNRQSNDDQPSQSFAENSPQGWLVFVVVLGRGRRRCW